MGYQAKASADMNTCAVSTQTSKQSSRSDQVCVTEYISLKENVLMYVSKSACKYINTYACRCVRMYVCMYVCM